MIAAPGRRPATARPRKPRRTVTLRTMSEPALVPTHPDRGAAQHRLGADRRGDPRHQRRGAGSLPDRRGRGRRPDHGPARPARDGRGRVRHCVGTRRSRRQHGRPRPDTRRPDPRGDRRRSGARPRSWTRTWSAGCATCGHAGTSRFRRPTSSRPGGSPQASPCPTRTARLRAGSCRGPTAGSRSPCPAHRARCGRCGPTMPSPACGPAASGADVAVRTYRLMGIGESQVAEILGESMLRNGQPGGRDLRSGRGGRRPHQRIDPERSRGRHQDGGGAGRGCGRGGHGAALGTHLGRGRPDLGGRDRRTIRAARLASRADRDRDTRAGAEPVR